VGGDGDGREEEASVSDHRTRLAQLVDEWNLSRDEVIRRFHRAGQELMARREVDERIDVSPRQLGRWMSGESRDPRPAARRVLEHMFQTTIAELLGPPHRQSDLVRPVPAPAAVIECVDDRAARRGAGNVYRLVVGERIEVPSAGEREVLLEMSAERASKFALVAGQSGLTAEAIEQIYEDVRRLAVAYPGGRFRRSSESWSTRRTPYSHCWRQGNDPLTPGNSISLPASRADSLRKHHTISRIPPQP